MIQGLLGSFKTALRPFQTRLFGVLWLSFLLANTCMWMFDSTATWLLVGQGASPLMIALVQTASTLPVFLLGLPSGALADMVDRKKLYLFTQAWLGVVACAMMFMIMSGSVGPWMILLLTFINGIGLSLRWPVYASLVPLVLPPKSMQQAFALNSASMNLSRILGPALAGWLLFQLPSAAVYAVIALVSGFVFVLLWRSDLPQPQKKLKRPPFLRVLRDGVINSFSDPRIRQVLLLISIFFFAGIAVIALAAVIASTRMAVNPISYALLLSSIGGGAVCAVFLIPLINEYFSEKSVFMAAVIGQAIVIALISVAHQPVFLFPLFCLSGFFWVVVVSLLTVSIQLLLTHAFRARGMAIYQLCLMGASALGATAWGGLATKYGLTTTFLVSGLTVLLCLVPAYPLVEKPHA